MSDTSDVTIVCARVSSLVVPAAHNSKTVACIDCRALCWLSPSAFHLEHTAILVCASCAVARIQATGEPVQFGILPGQITELLQALRRDN